jgi:hypothetical protein
LSLQSRSTYITVFLEESTNPITPDVSVSALEAGFFEAKRKDWTPLSHYKLDNPRTVSFLFSLANLALLEQTFSKDLPQKVNCC